MRPYAGLSTGAIVFAAIAATSATPLHAQAVASSDYLYVWTASADTTQPDFLAVLDVRPASGRYGRLVTTIPVPGLKNRPHHTEHEMPADARLFANGFGSGQTFVFDMTKRAHPRLDVQFGDVAGMMHPHSFLRLPNGNVLATFQMQHDSLGIAPGGLAELTNRGRLVRSVSANRTGVDRRIRPYSAVIIPKLDRIVTTTTDMDGEAAIQSVQLWRLSDLKPLRTFDLPQGPRGDEASLTAEPRLLADGRTVLVSTFDCGLYLLRRLDGPAPSGKLVASFPRKKDSYCAIPVIVGHYYLVTVPAWSAVVSLDISNPDKPREVSRVVLGAQDIPHWIALEPNHRRVVITGYGDLAHRVMMAHFDESTGRLTLDTRFRDDGTTEPGVRMDNKAWPHGGNAAGTPHGAVFSAASVGVKP
ncbi:MAG: selenium-binding family protein [Gemmatimonadota bacterium]|nr:selenium-binding family protein [Gemmatimonadota bacterium]